MEIDASKRSIRLPGYECQLKDDAVLHSKTKVESAASDVLTILTGEAGSSLERFHGHARIHTLPCVSYEETLNYRCSCTFQMISNDENSGNNEDEGGDNYVDGKRSIRGSDLMYAMRSAKVAVPLGGDYFPIATKRIQRVMKLVLEHLNMVQDLDESTIEHEKGTNYTYEILRSHLSSVSFASSWNKDRDCIATFNYCQPIHVDAETKMALLAEAHKFVSLCGMTTLILRSKKMKEMVGVIPPCINDILFIDNITVGEGEENENNNDRIKVALADNEGEGMQVPIPVLYHKPEDAFQHPNGNTMLQALEWMLNTIKHIEKTTKHKYNIAQESISIENTNCAKFPRRNFNLLEMYCGCGAHTMAISKTGIFDSIVAVELDQRLVDACKANSVLNGCCFEMIEHEDVMDQEPGGVSVSSCLPTSASKPTIVHVFQGEAGEWARNSLTSWRRKENNFSNPLTNLNATPSSNSRLAKANWYDEDYRVLLVDPPRMGLGKTVCDLAINGPFDHIIYVSCGRRALIGDLNILLKEAFEVVDCTLTDLFPRTDAVETLVHLRRRDLNSNTTSSGTS